MQYVDDDMDDVFRQAGKDYPLDISGADWDKIAAGLRDAELPRTSNDNRKYLWLLLLLPLPWLCMKYKGADQNQGIVAVNKQVNTLPGSINEPVLKNQDIHPANNSSGRTITPINNSGNNDVAGNQPGINNSTVIHSVNKNAAAITLSETKHGSASQQTYSSGGNGHSFSLSAQKREVKLEKNRGNNNFSKTGSTANNYTGATRNRPFPKFQNHDTTRPASNGVIVSNQHKPNQPALVSPAQLKGDDDFNKLPDTIGITTQNASDIKTAVAETSPVKQPEKKAGKPQKFYVGIITGLSVTSIKGQKASDPGLDLGILAGYNINAHFAVEAGAFSTRKYYYSDGSYYDKSKIYMPVNSKLTMVTGNCRMIEIPVSLRYNFNLKGRSTWLATAGISNYLMKKEDYDYTYFYYTGNYSATYHKTYKNASKDWLAVFQVSAGKQFTLGTMASLRVEPYLQLPLRGVGYGKLPLTSYGLRIGLTKLLSR
jgi:hypothetical protein